LLYNQLWSGPSSCSTASS